MSTIDKVEEPESPEVQETPSPENAKSPEEFYKLCEAKEEKIIDDIKSGKNGDQEKIADVADRLSPDEIKGRRDEFGDADAAQDKYRDAVFGEHAEWSDEERTEAIANAKEDYENAVYLREIYDEAAERQNADSDESGVVETDESEPTEDVDDLADDEVVTESDPEEADEDPKPDDDAEGDSSFKPKPPDSGVEPGAERGAREMTEVDKREYGVSDAEIRANSNEGIRSGLSALLAAHSHPIERMASRQESSEEVDEDADKLKENEEAFTKVEPPIRPVEQVDDAEEQKEEYHDTKESPDMNNREASQNNDLLRILNRYMNGR